MDTRDATIFLRDADQRDADHPVCHALLDRLYHRRVPLIEPFIVLAEVAGPLSRSYRDPMRGRIYVDILLDVPHITFISCDRTLARRAADLAADYALRGMDAIYVTVAQQHSTTLITLDEEVCRRASPIISVQTPAEALATLTEDRGASC